MLTDDAGAVVGRAFYDAYGGVISNTIPLTLTDRLYEGRPFDAATDLVYHGAGKYCDPQLGQRLQPNPSGGPPLLPQSLNRYAVPPVQSVVGQATGRGLAETATDMSVDILVDSAAWAAGKGLDPAFGAVWSHLAPRMGHLEVTANSALIERAGYENLFEAVGRPGRGKSTRFRSTRLIRKVDAPTLMDDIEPNLQNAVKSKRWGFKGLGFVEDFPLAQGILYKERPGLFYGKFKGADLVEGPIVGFFFDTGLEYARLANNPYLTTGQKWKRAGIVGITGAMYGAIVVATVGTGGVAFAVSLVLGWTVEKWTADAIIEAIPNLHEQRRLQPLQ
jgi:hypothetical protein